MPINPTAPNKMASTKIEINHNTIARLESADELARILFPDNSNHQKIFLSIFVELKWAKDQFLPVLDPIVDQLGLSRRSLETVRAKMRRMGLIDHVSRFNKTYGYREGWVFSNKFPRALVKVANLVLKFREKKDSVQEQKERDLIFYL